MHAVVSVCAYFTALTLPNTHHALSTHFHLCPYRAIARKAMLDGKVSANNWKMINNALTGALITGTEMSSSRGGKPSMLYTATARL